jgi:hypothetical protein
VVSTSGTGPAESALIGALFPNGLPHLNPTILIPHRPARLTAVEESHEAKAAPAGELLFELADVLEVLQTILPTMDITWEELRRGAGFVTP